MTNKILTAENIESIRLRADSGFLVDDDEWEALCDMALAHCRAVEEEKPVSDGVMGKLIYSGRSWRAEFQTPPSHAQGVAEGLEMAAKVCEEEANRLRDKARALTPHAMYSAIECGAIADNLDARVAAIRSLIEGKQT